MPKFSPENQNDQVVLDAIVQYREARGYAPSLREIGEMTGITSTSMVDFYLKRLERLGRIKRDQGTARSIVIL